MLLPSGEQTGMVALEQESASRFNSGSSTGTGEPRARLGPRQRLARRKAFLQQAIVLLIAGGLVAVLARNTVANLQARGLASGFDFLWQEAGLKMAFSLVPVEPTSTYSRVFLAGLLNSILVAAIGIVAATILGFIVGIARVSPSIPVRLAARFYVEAVRNLPLLLHLLLWQTVILRSLPTVRAAFDLGGVVFLSNRGLYLPAPTASEAGFVVAAALLAGVALVAATWLAHSNSRRGESAPWLFTALVAAGFVAAGLAIASLDWQVPVLAGFDFRGGVRLMPEFVSLVAALAIYNAAFIAEIVRAGIQSVQPGQREASAALGLPPRLVLRLVIVPQALRVMVPPVANQYTQIIKASALATVVGFPDLVSVFLGTSLNQTGRAVEIVAITACVYLSLCASVALATGLYNRRVALVER
ncbi:MAG: ABC transporter permease subunit [Hyphomicrobiales bacterium]|nr:MAG: ABC transporter permease subunit [Hyphomicrobiales bacterium]